jgi:hypothetical protein
MVTVIVATIALLSLRLFLQNKAAQFGGSLIGAILNALTILLFNLLWRKVAVILTKWGECFFFVANSTP